MSDAQVAEAVLYVLMVVGEAIAKHLGVLACILAGISVIAIVLEQYDRWQELKREKVGDL